MSDGPDIGIGSENADPINTGDDSIGADDEWIPVRRYTPGTNDPFLLLQRSSEIQEKQKREANRPTGTEIGQISQKLQALTEQLKQQQDELADQQQKLEDQQEALTEQQGKLEAAQEEIKRVTPTVSTVSGSSPGGSLGSGWTDLISLTAQRDTSDGKTRAQVTITVTAVKPGDGLPLLECLVGGVRVGSFPGVTANGDSFGGTAGASISSDQAVVLRGKSTTASASPVSAVSMSLSIMSIA
jgi:prefoldin subunit 5